MKTLNYLNKNLFPTLYLYYTELNNVIKNMIKTTRISKNLKNK